MPIVIPGWSNQQPSILPNNVNEKKIDVFLLKNAPSSDSKRLEVSSILFFEKQEYNF